MSRNICIALSILITLLSCKSPEARRPVQNNSGSFISKSIERNKTIFEKEELQITQLLDSNKDQAYHSSESGFWYYYNIKDTLQTKMPAFGDHVTFSYDVKKLNGTMVLSEQEIGIQNCIVDKTNQELISGIRDGLKLMKQGETITFLFPSYKAFGYYGIDNKLGTNVPVQCTVTLKTINQTNENY
jgi:gliding motility-associated peptidyl-prolyl isomerase